MPVNRLRRLQSSFMRAIPASSEGWALRFGSEGLGRHRRGYATAIGPLGVVTVTKFGGAPGQPFASQVVAIWRRLRRAAATTAVRIACSAVVPSRPTASVRKHWVALCRRSWGNA